ncbi:MAG: ACP S-malonyltransferase [Lentisphaeraceae bacterium]|nr:ACP S-malonyltransferase [Lentisphaeraceae bacterium]
MSKVYVFPGQGSQKIGMGEELFEKYADLVAQADEILGYSIKELCLEGPAEKLSQTQYTQPALYIVNALSYYNQLDEDSEKPTFVAGHSLGEYNALLASEVFDFATGLKLVIKRGEIMSKVEGGGMAAVLGMSADDIKATVENAGLDKIDVANFNSPKQTVLSGMKEDIVNAEGAFKDAGAKRYIVLPVSGAFHSRYMEGPKEEFKAFAEQFTFNAPAIPVISNINATEYDASDVLNTVAAQISSSVRWVETIQYIKTKGEFEFLELGPGKVLTSLIKQIG